jgi:hypothetical protein
VLDSMLIRNQRRICSPAHSRPLTNLFRLSGARDDTIAMESEAK